MMKYTWLSMMIVLGAIAVQAEIPEKWDKDSDGKLSEDEFVTMRVTQNKRKGKPLPKKQVTRTFSKIDVDADGFLTAEEYDNRGSRKEKSADQA